MMSHFAKPILLALMVLVGQLSWWSSDLTLNAAPNLTGDLGVRLIRLTSEPDLGADSAAATVGSTLKPTPVVFWHGMGDTANRALNIFRQPLERKFPGIELLSIQIGKSPIEDELATYFGNINNQVSQACEMILKSDVIKSHGSFNAVGFSQGAQFLRALIQRCPLKAANIRAKNFVSLGGQHQGVFGLPSCPSAAPCNQIRFMLSHFAYRRQVQEGMVQAAYWHDPLKEKEYRQNSIFLADLNNENQVNETYRENLLLLDRMVLVEFEQDEMVVPLQSAHFGFYAPNQTEKIVNLQESPLYLEDRLGLKRLFERDGLTFVSLPGKHLQFNMEWFLDKIASVYLNN